MTDEEVIYHLKLHARRTQASVTVVEDLRRKIGTLEIRLLTLQKRIDRIMPRTQRQSQ